MPPEQWQQVKDLLAAALGLAPSERAGWLTGLSVAAEVRALLTEMLADETHLGNFLATPLLAPPAQVTVAGLTIGPYQVEREIGRGGMGAVYLAHRADDVYHRQVAIKLVFPTLETPDMQARFHRERQILARLDHPHIARIIDGGTTEHGWAYLVMDYVQGVPIDVWCTTQQLTLNDRLRLVQEVCTAVEHAHQNLVVHRDIKPSNILITSDGTPRLLDFGIARILDPQESGGSLTRSALHFLTPEYASPEQLRGETVTTASDVYSLGILLYQLLTGRRPFALENLSLAQILTIVSQREPAAPSTVLPLERTSWRRQLVGDLDNITLRALRTEPADRYASVAQLREDLGRHLQGQPVLARPASLRYRAGKWSRRHPALTTLIAAVVLTLLTSSLFFFYQARVAKAEAQRERQLRYNTQIRQAGYDLIEGKFASVRATLDSFLPHGGEEEVRGFEWFYLWRQAHRATREFSQPGAISAVAYSPDGWQLASAGSDGTVKMWEPATGREMLTITEPGAQALAVVFSPDGKQIATAYQHGQIKIRDAGTGVEQASWSVPGGTPQALSFSPDGKRLLSASNGGASLFTLTTGKHREVIHPGKVEVLCVAFSPDGQTFVTGGVSDQVCFWDAATGNLQRTITARQGSVFALAISPDGKRLATSGGDFLIKLWDTKTLRLVQTLRGHTNAVRGVAFSPDGTQLLSGSADRTLRLWDVPTGQERNRFQGHTDRVRAVAFAPDGREGASAADDGTVRIWNMQEPETAEVLTGHTKRLFTVALSADGKTLATGGSDETVKLWDFETRQLRNTLNDGQGEIYALAFAGQGIAIASLKSHQPRLWQPGHPVEIFSTYQVGRGAEAFLPDGRVIVESTNFEGLEFIELQTGKPWLKLPGARQWGIFSPTREHVLTGGSQQTVKVWEVATGRELRSFPAGEQDWYWPSISPEGRVTITNLVTHEVKERDLTTGRERRLFQFKEGRDVGLIAPHFRHAALYDKSGGVTIRDLNTGRSLTQLNGVLDEARDACLSANEQQLAVGYRDGTIRVFETASGQILKVFHGAGTSVNVVRFSPGDDFLASADDSDQVTVWEIRTGQALRTFATSHGHLQSLRWSPDAQQLLSVSIGGKVQLWEVATGKILAAQQRIPVNGGTQAVAVSRDGMYLAVANGVVIALLHLPTKRVVQLLVGHQPSVWSLSFSPDGTQLASASWDGTARLWETQTGKELFVFRHQNLRITAIQFSPDGRLVASGGDDHRVRIWDAQTGKEVRVCDGHADGIRALAWSPDGHRIASAGVDQIIRLWRCRDGAELLTLTGHTDEVWSLLFTPDGHSLVSGSWDKTARIWLTAPDPRTTPTARNFPTN